MGWGGVGWGGDDATLVHKHAHTHTHTHARARPHSATDQRSLAQEIQERLDNLQKVNIHTKTLTQSLTHLHTGMHAHTLDFPTNTKYTQTT